MLADQFRKVFREEHRKVRDKLLDLIQAFQTRDKVRIGELLNEVAALTGPHFRYEEDALYPALVKIFGEEYVEELLSAHDGAIGMAEALVALAEKEALTDDDVTNAAGLIRRVLPHVSDCDGLSIMVELLPEDEIRSILETRERSLDAGLDLLQWSREVRSRPSVAPS